MRLIYVEEITPFHHVACDSKTHEIFGRGKTEHEAVKDIIRKEEDDEGEN